MAQRRKTHKLGWRLAARLARREMRGGPDYKNFAGFRIFLLCLILGIFTISGVGSLSASLVAGLAAQGQAILGGDIDLRLAHRQAFDAERQWLARQWLERQAKLSHIATMRAMARHGDDAMLVEAKAVDNAYPLYGAVRLDRDMRLSAALAPRQTAGGVVYGAVAEQGLFDRLAVSPGAILALGKIRVQLNAVLTGEPDRNAGGFPLAPRLMVSHETLAAAGLLRPGALVNHHYRLQLPPASDTDAVHHISAAAAQNFPNAGWRIRDRADAAPSMRRFIERLGLFLTLVGLTALVVGGVGVGNAIGAYLQRRRETIAIIKALGGSGRFIFRIYAVQIGVLSVFGLAIGLALGAAVPFIVKHLFGTLLPVDLVVGLYPAPLLAASGFGLLAAAAFALWPLGQVERTPVTALFRAAAQTGVPPPRYLLAIGVCFAGLGALALLISERRDIAIWFTIGVALSYFALRAAAALVVWLAKSAGRPRQPELRLALSNITRPNAPVRAVMLSIGLSVTLLSAISMVDGNIHRQITQNLPARAPSFFLLDIAPDQIDRLRRQMAANPQISQIQTSPMLRGQILSLKGVPAARIEPAPDAAWVLRGDRGLTYARAMPDGSELVEGAWWPRDYDGPPLVSFDVELARALGLSLGDAVEVNVLGRPLTASIANLRIVDWASGGMNFVMVFSPAPLVDAPHGYLVSMTIGDAGAPAFARALARDYPNVVIIRVKEAIAAMGDVLTNLGLGVRAMSGLTLLTGILVLAGAMASGHKARVYDAVVMKVLGATRWRIMAAFALEYALIGLAGAIIAAVAGTLAAFALITGPMQAAFIFLPVTLAMTVLGAVGLTVILGLIGTYAALRAPAAPSLRSE